MIEPRPQPKQEPPRRAMKRPMECDLQDFVRTLTLFGYRVPRGTYCVADGILVVGPRA